MAQPVNAEREALAVAAEARAALAELRDAEASRARNPERYRIAGEAFLAVRGLSSRSRPSIFGEMNVLAALLAEASEAANAGDEPRRLRALSDLECLLGVQPAEPAQRGAILPPRPYRYRPGA